ncbi:MAG: hypothetical protein JWP61_2568 [Friedmanniella sp.]|nr:hypothetical protein [Friedmanniella sp.]
MNRQQLARHAGALGFAPQDCVRWLSPVSLVRIGLKVVVAEIFADFGDKRELQAVFTAPEIEPPTPDARGDLWFDYVSDTGDGFDATYNVAWLLGQPELEVALPDPAPGEPGTIVLPRGRLLVLGGDEVYPTASVGAYEDRTTGPFGAAFPAGADHPTLLALPGNHDWYDGLSSFLRIFTARSFVGSWRTVQSRSYFAVRLRPGWWLVGLDSQLGEYIDAPQLDYFHTQLSTRLAPGDAIIFCAATPAWVHGASNPDAFNSLHYFERNFLRGAFDKDTQTATSTGAQVRLWLSGDSHHYTRYEEQGPDTEAGPATPDPRRTQLVTCGLGGAYLSETYTLPDHLALPPRGSRMRSKDPTSRAFTRAGSTYPTPEDSRRLSRRLAVPFTKVWLPLRNPWFGFTIGAVHLLLFAVLVGLLSVWQSSSVDGALRHTPVGEAALFALVVLALPLVPVVVTAVTAVIGGADWPVGKVSALVALCLQLVVAHLLLILAVALPWPASWPDAVVLLGAAALACVGGSALGSEAFALFILLVRRGEVAGWRMAGQAVEDHKGLLRMCLRADGSLEVYPIVLDEICRDWDLAQVSPGSSRPVPATPLRPRLVEPAIHLSQKGFDDEPAR